MPRPHPSRRFAPAVEPLESRVTPATHTWDGGGNADNWADNANWVGDDNPAAGETNVIIVFNTNAGTTLQDIPNLQVRTLRFDAGSTTTVQLDQGLILDGTGTTDTIVDRVGTNAITGAGDLVLSGGDVTVLTDDTAGRLVISANLTGTQGLIKTGAGALELAALSANTYSGITRIVEGDLFLNTSSLDGGVSANVVVGDGVGEPGTAALRLRNIFEIPDTADVTVEDDGLIELVGAFTEDVSSLTLNGGVLSIGAGATFRLFGNEVTVGASGTKSEISGAGTFDLAGGTTTFTVEPGTATGSVDLEVSARVRDPFGGIVKAGAGRMTLSGNNDYGSTLVTEGTLDIDGVQLDDPVTVTGGTLGGGGQVGTITVTGGSIAPGSSAGAVGTNGTQLGSRLQADDTTLTDATYEAAVFTNTANQPGGAQFNANLLDVTGTLSLTNVTLNLTRFGPASVVGRAFVIVQNDGTDPITGTFAGIAEGGSLVVSGQTFFVTYVGGDGNDVLLVAGPIDPSINQPPVAVDDASATRPGEAVTIPVLVNDEDANGDALVVASVGTPLNGTAAARSGGVEYTPNAGFQGTDTFTYTVSDGRGGASTATVTVTVSAGALPNRPPVAANDTVATAPGTFVRVPVLLNDTDRDGDALSVSVAPADQPAAGGTVVANADGTITFVPAPGFTGTTTFAYTISDGRDGTARAVVTVTVRAGGAGPGRQVAVGLDRGGTGTARLVNPDRSTRPLATPFAGAAQSGVRTAAADFNGDGVAELVVGTGPNGVARVRVLDGVNQNELFSVQPFEDAFTGGVFVAAGDVTGDGVADLVITPDEGGGPRVRIFSGGANFAQVADFFGIDDANFRGGARAAVGDMNGDGVGDLVVSAGFGGGPRVAGFDGTSLVNGVLTRKLFADFFAFEQGLRNGAFVTAGDIDGDGLAELIAGGGPGGGPRVTAFSGAGLVVNRPRQVANFFSGNPANRGGVRVAVKDLDGDNLADLVTGSGPGGGSRVTAYSGTNLAANFPTELFAIDAQPGFTGGVFVG